jgi:hypothetical protein
MLQLRLVYEAKRRQTASFIRKMDGEKDAGGGGATWKKCNTFSMLV